MLAQPEEDRAGDNRYYAAQCTLIRPRGAQVK